MNAVPIPSSDGRSRNRPPKPGQRTRRRFLVGTSTRRPSPLSALRSCTCASTLPSPCLTPLSFFRSSCHSRIGLANLADLLFHLALGPGQSMTIGLLQVVGRAWHGYANRDAHGRIVAQVDCVADLDPDLAHRLAVGLNTLRNVAGSLVHASLLAGDEAFDVAKVPLG